LSTPPDIGRAAEPGERVEQDHDVAPALDEPLRPLDREAGEADVRVRRGVRRRGEDLRGHDAAEVRDLLRPLVHEQQDEVHVRVALCDRLAEVLEQRRLARLGR
jgi:hypothetical protein